MVTRHNFIKRAESKEALRHYADSGRKDATVFPDFSMEKVLSMIDNDPVARRAVTHFVDKAMEGGYDIIKLSDNTKDIDYKNKLESKFKFEISILRKTFLIGKMFQNVFLEIVRTEKDKSKQLNVLDTSNIKIHTLPNGDVQKYISKTVNPQTNQAPEWMPSEIVHIKFADRGGNTWSTIDAKALWENLLWKQYIKQYSSWLWKTGQYKTLYNLAEATPDQITDFLGYLRATNNDPTKPSIIQGQGVTTAMLRDMKENESMDMLLAKLDNQTLVLLGVAPIEVGITDNSGRSNSDNQSNSLHTGVTAYKQIIADAINNDLFKKITKSNNKLIWKPTDRFVKKQCFENLNILKNMGMTDEACAEYLQSEGIYFKTKSLFNKPEEKAEVTPGAKKDINLMDSRRSPEVKGADKKVGAGQESSTREDQLMKRSSPDFNSYPYILGDEE